MRGRRYRRRETPSLRLGSRRRAAHRLSDSQCTPVGRIPGHSMRPRSPARREARHRGSTRRARPNASRARCRGPHRPRPCRDRRWRRRARRQESPPTSLEKSRRRSRRDWTLSTHRTQLPPEAAARAGQGNATGSRTSERRRAKPHGIAVAVRRGGPRRAEPRAPEAGLRSRPTCQTSAPIHGWPRPMRHYSY